MKLRSRIISVSLALLLAAGSVPAIAAPKGWEPAHTERSDFKTVVKEMEAELKTSRGLLVLTVTKPSQIKVVTILGRTIWNDTLPAGSHELHLAHGVYIVKVGEVTYKVAV